VSTHDVPTVASGGNRPPVPRAYAVNEHGVVLPVALLALSVLGALMIALGLLATIEPAIANNQVMSASARAAAESGVERALWALSHPTLADGIAEPMSFDPAPAPYDGSLSSFRVIESINGVGQSGFVVTVTSATSGSSNERDITSVGYVPDASTPRAIKRIAATAMRIKWLDPPCAFCFGGESPQGPASPLQVGGTATVNASSTTGVPPAVYCAGQTPTAAILATGAVNTSGSPNVGPAPSGVAITQGANKKLFEPFTLTDLDVAILKLLAKSAGTYYQGAQSFAEPPPDGIVFVDTPSGNSLTNSSPASDLFEVDIHGDWSGGWRGWFVVAGSVRLSDRIDMTGLIYAQNDVDYRGAAAARVRGAIIASNRVPSVAGQADSAGISDGKLTYDCPAVRNGGGALSERWFLKPGSYREMAGQ